MKKRTVLCIVMLALVASMLSMTAFATQVAPAGQPDVAVEPAEVTAGEPASEPADSEGMPTEPLATGVPATETTVVIGEADVQIAATVASWTVTAGQSSMTAISECKEFPLILDLTALPDDVAVLAVPKEVIDAIGIAYQAVASNADVLKIITETHEYIWGADNIQALTAQTAPTVMLAFEEAKTVGRREATQMVAVAFAVEEEQKTGILIVSKDATGQWQVTEQSMYSSAVFPVLMIVLLVLIVLAAIVVVNLIIIKIYRSQM